MIAPRVVAIFDLDHTLARRDTYLQYLGGFLKRHPWRILRVCSLPVSAFLFLIGRLENAALKERFLHAVLGGASRREIEEWTRFFVDQLIDQGVYGDALRVIEEHRSGGHRLMLLSASPDCYVPAIGLRLGFDEVVCTVVEWEHDRITGRLLGPNMRGEEKARVLKGVRERFPGARIVAYADHSADLAMLQLADTGVLVNGTRGTRTKAEGSGLRTVNWI